MSKVAATGYSFPSGHSVSASSLYGSVVENQWSKRRWLAIFCTICILLTGFSRNFLGVHTPQDVIVGLTEGMWNGITFTTRFPGAMSISPIQSGVSVALLFVWKTYFEKAMVIPLLGGHWGNLVSRFVMHFIALTLIPMLIMKSARESGYVDQAA